MWLVTVVAISLLFGIGALIFGGGTMGGEYFAGHITERALSVDNLFVFLIIMTSFRVPREDQQKVLLFGITFSLLGLRQLYFLLDGLLDRLIFLSYGLAAILAFIGAKLILHALHENNIPFINDGEATPAGPPKILREE